MTNFFKERMEEIGLKPDDVVFQLRRDHDIALSSMAVRGWVKGRALPSLDLAGPLASILKTTKAKLLNAMNEMAVARKSRETANSK